ncbi:MAG: ATP-grasp domain-containing protein [Acidobacteriota bacterium]|nr:ATP-grasp domain-containing protein [Acidobacteriota bacterium]
MPDQQPTTILCVSSFEKGQEFIRTCKALGCRILLLTVEKLQAAGWPRDCLDKIFTMPEDLPLQGLIYSVSYIARSQAIDRIVALDEFDMENVSALREHLRIPGMGSTTVRYFRDKLAMRARAREAGIRVPEFIHVLNYDHLREYMARVPAPWLLKPRSQASGIGMKKIHSPDELWPLLDQLGDRQSFYLLEQFVPGVIYHIDSIASEREVVFAEVHTYGTPPFITAHHGGVFTSSTLPFDAPEAAELRSLNRQVLNDLGFVRGVTHAEFLKSDADGKFYFIEVAARVGGAYISDLVEAATGINLWREWARLEVGAGQQPYSLPPTRREFAAVILSLARQEHPDTSSYADPEIVQRISKYHHAGLILKSPRSSRIQELLAEYANRFQIFLPLSRSRKKRLPE